MTLETEWSKLPRLREDRLIFEDTSGAPIPGTIVPCLLCTKPFLMPQYIGADVDQICGECFKTYMDAARVVCWKCKITVCRLVPKLLDNGYYIQPRTVLHTSACNICKPGLKTSDIIEITEWMKCTRERKIIVPFKQIKRGVK